MKTQKFVWMFVCALVASVLMSSVVFAQDSAPVPVASRIADRLKDYLKK